MLLERILQAYATRTGLFRLYNLLLQLGSGFGSIMYNLKGNLRTIGSRCRLAAGVQVFHSLISFVMKKMAQQRKDIGSDTILAMLTGLLSKSKGYLG